MAPEVVDTEDPTRLIAPEIGISACDAGFLASSLSVSFAQNSGSRFARYCTEIYSMRSILQRNLVFHFAMVERRAYYPSIAPAGMFQTLLNDYTLP